MKLVCLELSFDAAGRSAADNLARPNYCAIEIHFSIGDRTIRGEKQISIRALSLYLSISLSLYVCIYISVYPSFEDRSIPIPSIKSGSIKRHTLRWRPYGGANTHGVCGFGHTCRAEKRVSGAKFKYFSADGTTPACSATLRKFVPLRVRVCRT